MYGARGQNLEEARGMAAKAIELEPGNLQGHLVLAQVLLRQERPEEALKIWPAGAGRREDAGRTRGRRISLEQRPAVSGLPGGIEATGGAGPGGGGREARNRDGWSVKSEGEKSAREDLRQS